MTEKRFLLSDYWVEDDEFDIELESRCNEFIKKYFPNNVDDIEFTVGCMGDSDDMFKFNPYFELIFTEFEYVDGRGFEECESIGIYMSEEKEQFYLDNGEWKMKYVYDYHTGSPIQKVDTIYGIDKDDIYRKFKNHMLTV